MKSVMLNRNLIYIFLVGSLACLSSFSLGDDAVSSEDLLAKRIASFFEPQIRQSTRDLYIYHYFKTPTIAGLTANQVNQDHNADLLRAHAFSRIDYMFKILREYQPFSGRKTSDGQTATAIPGFYAALDPVDSAQYGGRKSNWTLLEIILKPGFKYLVLGASAAEESPAVFEVALPNNIKSELAGMGCELLATSLLFVSPPSQKCALVAEKILNILAVDAVLYPFGAGLKNVCPQQPLAAFLFVGRDALNTAQFKAFTSTSFLNPAMAEDVQRLQSILDLKAPKFFNSDFINPRRYHVKTWSHSTAEDWAHDSLFGCGKNQEEFVDTKTLNYVNLE